MSKVLVRRSWQALIVLFWALTAVFFLVRLSGDPTLLFLPENATEEDVVRIRHAFGFDRPIGEQYLSYLYKAGRGNFGSSLRYDQPALPMVLSRLPATAQLAAATLFFTVIVALPLGVIAATRRNSWLGTTAMILALFGQSIPNYVLGIALVLLFAVILGVLPAAGRVSFSSLVLPAVTLAAYPTARLARVVRSELLDILAQDYIRTARAKGLSAKTILTRHALRNSLIPVVTILGMDLGFLLGGAIIVETVFAWPGVGSLVIQSVNNRDYPVVQASAFLMAAIFVVMNLLVDLLYSTLDPRVRYG